MEAFRGMHVLPAKLCYASQATQKTHIEPCFNDHGEKTDINQERQFTDFYLFNSNCEIARLILTTPNELKTMLRWPFICEVIILEFAIRCNVQHLTIRQMGRQSGRTINWPLDQGQNGPFLISMDHLTFSVGHLAFWSFIICSTRNVIK